jgi:hypothetical protein
VRPAPTAHPLTLTPPLHGSRLAVVEGGGPATNRHAKLSLTPGARHSRRYAVEFAVLGGGAQWRRRRALGLAPATNTRYAAYGEIVHAPCDGVVVSVLDGLPDHEPGVPNGAHPDGNHLAIDNGRALVVLAWLQQDSILPRRGERLTAGTAVAAVGNSGDGFEPALLLRAETRGSRPTPGTGEGLPFRLQGLRGLPLRGRRFTPDV